MIVKNTYGKSVGYSLKQYPVIPSSEFTGSSLQRKKTVVKKEDKPKDKKNGKEKEVKLRSMSQRTRQKIRKKVTAFSRLYKRISFVTLTFLNQVSDEQAVDILRKFIDNVKKRSEDFQYVWVVERQTKNDVFKGNVHFHMLTNKYWDIDKWWNYWINLKIKNGIVPREKDYKPSSAFDVKQINTNNIKAIASYLTKYVTKNNEEFKCQVWNCSKKVSELYTDFYTNEGFVDQFEKLNAIEKSYELRDDNNKKFLDIKLINLNKHTLALYKRLDEKNREVFTNI